jgi:hypothetical protein
MPNNSNYGSSLTIIGCIEAGFRKGTVMKTDNSVKLMVSFTLFCAVAMFAQDVQYNYDREADFTAYKSYQWVERDRRTSDQLVDKDIRRAIDDQLARKGMQRVEGNGDLHILYQTAVDREKQLEGWSMGPRWSAMARANTSTIEVGTLILNIYDPAKKQLVWRGSATKTLNINKDPDKNYKNLEKAVAKLLRNYPPDSKK